MNLSTRRFLARLFAAAAVLALLFGCSGPEEKKMKFYGKGKSYYDKGDYVRARLELKNALQIDARFAQAHALLGMVELKGGNLNGAFSAFARAVELNPKDYDSQVRLGRMLLIKGEVDRARERADLVLSAVPSHEEGLLLRGAVYLAEKDPARAAGHLLETAGRGVKHPDLFLLLASAHREMKNDPEAEKAIRRGLSLNPDSRPLHRALADLLAAGGRVDEAAAEIRRLMGLEPSNYGYALTLAGLYWNHGREAEAREVLARIPATGNNGEKRVLDVAGFYMSRRAVADAEKTLYAGIAATRGSYYYRMALGEIYVMTGRPEKGIAVLKECLALDRDQEKPAAVQAKNALAKIYLEMGATEEAKRLLAEIFKSSPRNLDANLTSGRLAMLKGEAGKAVSAFQIIVNERPNQVQGYLLLAEAQHLDGKPILSLESLKQARKLAPDSVDVVRAFAGYYVRQRDLTGAEAVLRQSLDKKPGDIALRAALGDLYRQSRQTGKAEAAYTEVKGTAGGAVIGRVKLSELYRESGKTERAIAELAQAAELAPRSGELFTRLIRLHASRMSFGEAEAACRKRIAARPGDALPYLLLGEIQSARGDYRQAEDSLLRAQRLEGSSILASLALAQLQVKAGEMRKACGTYEAAMAKQPESWVAANDYACMLTDHGNGGGDLGKALNLAEQASSRFPDNPLIMDTLGWIHYRRGDYRKAAELLERCAVRLSDRPVIRYHAGMALLRTGRVDQARPHLRYAAASRENFFGKDEAVRMAGPAAR